MLEWFDYESRTKPQAYETRFNAENTTSSRGRSCANSPRKRKFPVSYGMRILIKATALDLTPALKVYIERKLGAVGKLLRPFEKEGETELRVEIARNTRHHRSGPVFMAEANLRLPGKVLRAVENHIDARAAVDKVENKLRLEVEKYRTKTIERPRRGQPAGKAGRQTG